MYVYEFGHGNLSQSQASAALVLDLIKTPLDGHSQWQYLERVIIGSNTYDVYRCLAGNAVNMPFIVALRMPDTAANAAMTVAEDWDATNKLLIRYAPTGGQPVDSTASYSVGNAGVALNNAVLGWKVFGSNLSAQNYILGVHDDVVVLASNSSGGVWGGITGQWFPGQNAVDPLPLHVCYFGSGNFQATATNAAWANAHYTREPLGSGVGNSFEGSPMAWIYAAGVGKDPLTNRYPMSPVAMRSRISPSVGFPGGAALRGLMTPDILWTAAGATFGDRLIVEGFEYVGVRNGIWLRKDA